MTEQKAILRDSRSLLNSFFSPSTICLHPQALGDVAERKTFEDKLQETTRGRFAVVRQAKLAEADSGVTDMLSKATAK